MQGRAAKLTEKRLELGLSRLGAGLDRWDRRLGAAYARVTTRRLVRSVGHGLIVLLLVVVVIGKWNVAARLFDANRGANNLTTWAVAFNHLLQIPFLLLVAFLVIVRRPAQVGTARLSGILAALGGTLAAPLLILESNSGMRTALAPFAAVLLVAGMGWAIWSLATLGRCFSLLPEVRGLVMSGPYRWVRHPAYLGEITATLGLLLPVLSARNVAVFVLFCALQLWRMRNEETALAATFPEYADYRRRTARLLPALW